MVYLTSMEIVRQPGKVLNDMNEDNLGEDMEMYT